MHPWLITWSVLADGARAEQFVKGFREGNLQRAANYDALAIAVAGLAIAVAFYMIERFRRSRQAGAMCSDRRLFADLCKVHQLDRAAIWLLQQIARQAQLTSAVETFVRPDLFVSSDSLRPRERDLMARVRSKLFAS